MKSKKSFLFISCEEAMYICDKKQYGEATFWEFLQLNIRLSWCKIIRRYSRNNVKLTKAIKSFNPQTLSQEEKQQMHLKLKPFF